MLNWLPTALLAKQTAKFAVTRLNALSRWHNVPSGHYTVFEVDPVTCVNIYLSADYCLDFCSLIKNRDNWNPNTVISLRLLDIYTYGSKFENRVGRDIYSNKLYGNIYLCLPDYCNVFQAEVLAIYRAAQWILVNDAPFTCVSIFSDSQPGIKPLSGFVNNSRFAREFRRCLDFF